MKFESPADAEPTVAAHLDTFDPRSGNVVERAIFNHRLLVILLCLVLTLLLGWQARGIGINASFEKTIPTQHPYIANFLAQRSELSGVGNVLRIAVATQQGDIFNAAYLDTLARLNDELYLLPGVDRPYMKSLWTPTTRWTAVTEEGLDGGTVIPDGYDGSPASLDEVRANVARSGEIGQLVASDMHSSVIFLPLLDRNPQTGEPLDYAALSQQLEALRAKYQAEGVSIHITGFSKIVGDLLEGLGQVALFFVIAVLVSVAMLLAYTRCLRSTFAVVACSLVGVLWQVGLLASLGYALDPYSILVPFLVFAIGMSHGSQKMNGIMQDIGRGLSRLVAARMTFRRLFLAGLTALISDAVGFAVLWVIDIQVIRDLAITASIGVAVLVLTNLILLPVLLSYTGVSAKAAQRSLRDQQGGHERHPLWSGLSRFATPRRAVAALLVGAVLALGGKLVGSQLQIGDLDPGAPELRADSRYNRDAAFMTTHYAASSDIFVIMVRTPEDQCTRYNTLAAVDELAWRLEQLPGVEATNSMASLSKMASAGYNEGNLKWYELIPNEGALGAVQTRAPRELFNQGCSLLSLYVYLADHKAATLSRVVAESEAFIAQQSLPDVKFMLAAGSAGIEAATNIVVEKAMHEMLYWVYGAVILLCWITFRNWRAVLAAILPLMLTSVLAEALMVALGMGVKVATLPVIALGVGIGIDYALYVLSVLLARMKAGDSLVEAYYSALLATGKVVLLTGLTLAIAVATWVFSPIKFQADMGILLAFMFLVNMLGALILLPALAWLLLPRGGKQVAG
ncbi:efflux RND transporter permease subunit [Pseudomonas sp. NCHU5208]|uniref:efflux RND transporter permease subunit n=1 Tax=unclassified Pseudomonas TaxID=196821 RepID=UPI003F94EA40